MAFILEFSDIEFKRVISIFQRIDDKMEKLIRKVKSITKKQ